MVWRYATRCRDGARQLNVPADGLRLRAPPADDATRRGAALNLLPAEKDATPVNPAQLMPGQR